MTGAGAVRCQTRADRVREKGADVKHLKALLAAEITSALERGQLTVRRAQAMTGTTAADFSRIRTADLERFTIDRLILIINRLGLRMDAVVTVRRAEDDRTTFSDVQ